MGIWDISTFIASSTPSRLGNEKNTCLELYFQVLLSGNFLIIVLLCPGRESLWILWQKKSKSLINSKCEASLAVGTKLKPLLSRRIWGSVRSLPDRLATYDLAHVIQFVLVHCRIL